MNLMRKLFVCYMGVGVCVCVWGRQTLNEPLHVWGRVFVCSHHRIITGFQCFGLGWLICNLKYSTRGHVWNTILLESNSGQISAAWLLTHIDRPVFVYFSLFVVPVFLHQKKSALK